VAAAAVGCPVRIIQRDNLGGVIARAFDGAFVADKSRRAHPADDKGHETRRVRGYIRPREIKRKTARDVRPGG